VWPFRRPRITLLVLCSANICRSPAAALLLEAALARRGLKRRLRVISAGTAVGAPGAPADPRMIAIAAESGLRLRGHRAQPLTPALLEAATAVYAMEAEHLEASDALVPEATAERALFDPAGEPVDDPYFGDKAGVRAAFERLALHAEARAGEWEHRLAGAAKLT
jgi:protein-tyrosine phosphatase